MPLVIIDRNTVVSPIVDGEIKSRGCKRRDFGAFPVGSIEAAPMFPDSMLIPRNEMLDRLHALKESKSQPKDVRLRSGPNGSIIPALDQNGKGYCWYHSGVSCLQLTRAMQNEPWVNLSAYAGAATLKHFKDEGGFGGDGLKDLAKRGCPTAEHWPLQSMDPKHDNTETWANALLHRHLEWFDLEPGNLDQYLSAKLHRFSTINDYNWWGHSVAGCGLEDILGFDWHKIIDDILNSWGMKWGDNGVGRLKDDKTRPDSCFACRVSTPSIAA